MLATNHLAYPALLTLPNQIKNPHEPLFKRSSALTRENYEIFILILTSKLAREFSFTRPALPEFILI